MSAKKVLLFGSGLVARSVLTYFAKQPSFSVTMASSDREALEKIKGEFPKDVQFVAVDVNDRSMCTQLIGAADIVISLLPPPLHPTVAEYCLEVGRDLVTSSYLNPTVTAMNARAEEKKVAILFELGLDPGIDHVATLKIVDEIRAKGGRIKSMFSFCGGLVSPESVDNPLCYKFTWSPIGVFRALLNDATYLEHGKTVTVKARDLLYSSRPYTVNNALNIAFFPNRDSLKYRSLYKIDEAKTVIRGTFRYKGFAEIIAAFQELGMLAETPTVHFTWPQHILAATAKSKLSSSILTKNELKYLQAKFPGIDFDKLRMDRVLGAVTSHKLWTGLTKDAILQRVSLVLEGLDHFGFLTNAFKLDAKKSVLENFVDTLTPQLALKPTDADTVVMTIKFEVEYPDYRREEVLFQFITTGEKGGMSAMGRTVGTSTAIGAKLIADGTIKRKGVFGPFTPDVYGPVFEEMVREGLVPRHTVRSFKAKL